MTIHSHVDYQCKFCDTYFVPIPGAPYCPTCNKEADKVFDDFVGATLDSVSFNLRSYHSAMPLAWYEGTIGDFYYYNAFSFLSFVASRTKILLRRFSDEEIDTLTTTFLDHVNFELSRREGFKTYFSLLLELQPFSGHRDTGLTGVTEGTISRQ